MTDLPNLQTPRLTIFREPKIVFSFMRWIILGIVIVGVAILAYVVIKNDM